MSVHNIFAVLKRDFKRLLGVPTAWLIVIGCICIPPLYAWYNIVGFWNPYGNTKNLTVAVANNDKGTDNELIGKQNLGDQIVSTLKENTQLGWSFMNETEAMKAVESAKAYAAIVIPSDFSDNLAGVITGGGDAPTLEYYVNEKASAVTPKVADVGASTVDRQVNATFVSTVSKVLSNAINSAGDKAVNAGNQVKDESLSSVNDAQSDVQKTRDAINDLITKLNDTPTKTANARAALENARTLGGTVTNGLNTTSSLISSTQDGLNSFVSSTSSALDKGSSLLSQASSKANQDIGTITGTLNSTSQQVSGFLNTAQDINNANSDLLDKLKALPTADEDPLKSAIALLESQNQQLTATLNNLSYLNTTISNTATSTKQLADNLNSATQTTLNATNDARNNLVSGALPQLNSGLNSLSSTSSVLSSGVTSQSSLLDQAKLVLDQLDQATSTATTAISDTDDALQRLQSKLGTITTDLNALSLSNTIDELLGGDGKLNTDTIANFMQSPTVLKETSVYPVSSYGSGMAPLFTTLALWVGAFTLVVIPKLEVDDEDIDNLTPTQAYLGRWLLLAIFAACQGLITGIGDLIIGTQCLNAPAFLFTCVLTSLVYISITYALSTSMLHVGRGICVALVILQVPGASGLYPIEMMPWFFRKLYPLFPFTYSIDAMRETIGGFYNHDWLKYLGQLLIFAALAFMLGLLVRPKLANLNRLFARELAEGGIINSEDVKIKSNNFRVSQAINALADHDDYRKAIEKRATEFAELYPKLIKGALIAGIVVPAVLAIVFSVTTSEKPVMLGTWLVWFLLIIGFLMVVEYMKDSIERQVELGNLPDDTIRALIYANESKKGKANALKSDDSDESEGEITQDIHPIETVQDGVEALAAKLGIRPSKEGRHAR